MKKGLPISPGVVVARAFVMDQALSRQELQRLEAGGLNAEIQKLDEALVSATQELDKHIARLSVQLGEDQAAIFRAHRLLLRDPALVAKVKSIIRTRQVDARSALQEVQEEYTALFSQIQDEYFRERLTDLRDVINRLATHLNLGQPPHQIDVRDPMVIVAAEILPSQAAAFDRFKVAGIITESGGTTGHAAILARSLGIPAVSGLRGVLKEIHTGDLVAVDGREGHVHLRPGPELEAAYRKLQREYVVLRESLITNRDLEAKTLDGILVNLLANVNSAADAVTATQSGAVGVGLYRTEYLFLTHPSIPDEEEQLAAYRAVIEAVPNKAVTIRTLDLGGDKQLPYLGDHRETNPFMGWRSIRLSSAHPELFQTQLRAILRAGVHGEVKLLFPMISTLEEVQRIKRMVAKARQTLERQHVKHNKKIPLGVMLEVPSAALCIEALLDEVDFVSIGSNDLIQYVMAADRDNPKVAHLCEPFSPAILCLLNSVISACSHRGTPVTLCGEMAARPRCFLPLFGMGLRNFSMSPAFVPPLKELVRRTTLAVAQSVTERVLKMNTFGEIRGFLTKKVQRIWPDVGLLD